MACVPDDYDIDMVFVEGGDFIMGSDEYEADPDEAPVHEVSVNSFYVGRFEVTQKQWKRVMGKNPSMFKGDERPVECVSWDDVQLFIKKLNSITGHSFRLPSEIEWEYAASGGNNKLSKECLLNIYETAWFVENSESISHRVGTLQPNELGIYDMLGNVYEWCNDVYDSLSYARRLRPGSENLDSTIKVYRGGCWLSSKKYVRIPNRGKGSSDLRNYCLGFRLVEDCACDER